jgi:hypothetical protein
VGVELLDVRRLNRATLDRQLLLRRVRMPAAEAVERLAGMQAQAPLAPYVGLWTRLDGFDPGELAGLLHGRGLVRVSLMRATIHLVTAADCQAWAPLLQPVMVREWKGHFGQRTLPGVDVDALLAAGRELLAGQARTRGELGRLLRQQWPDQAPESLAYAVTYLVPTLQPPPRGIWGASGPAAWTTIEAWLGPPPPQAADGADAADTADTAGAAEMIRRYLAAFGPAGVIDMQTWSGLTRLNEVVERIRPSLRTFRDEHGREVYDLPDAPRPDPDTPAPPRLLPAYDNVLLSHADRSRVIAGGRAVPLPPGNGETQGTALLDGFFRATWRIERRGGAAVMIVQTFEEPPAAARTELAEECDRLLTFVAPEAEVRDVRIESAAG